MKLHLDDDTADGLLVKLLRKAGHDIQFPREIGMVSEPDPVHLTRAIRDGRVCLTKNYNDFWLLHLLLMQAKGSHPGVLVIRQDNDPTRDLTQKGIVASIRKLESSGMPIANEYIVLNQWR
jgi:predicted nuclease of predicted toxin-antitoxin system